MRRCGRRLGGSWVKEGMIQTRVLIWTEREGGVESIVGREAAFNCRS